MQTVWQFIVGGLDSQIPLPLGQVESAEQQHAEGPPVTEVVVVLVAA